ncbi:ImmA/IrrE family metallo-endopeptidase [Kocuria marina]|uniref:ImmA/IrrE family metallo-endopeptidase n=1 Tax=Kocuria marina TaxID=223184 RepID=UPI0022E7CAEB|nr:ImmA/IrrE family metallo-endopeptidase [Kocuria marina]
MFDPWAKVSELGIDVHTVPLEQLSGCTDGTTIWLDTHLTTTERRCTLTHELVHLTRGHTGHQALAAEDAVREETARLLVSWEALHAHCGAQLSAWHLAQEIGVTERVLADRLHHASAAEIAELRGAAG